MKLKIVRGSLCCIMELGLEAEAWFLGWSVGPNPVPSTQLFLD
jgi:hypothetical protein